MNVDILSFLCYNNSILFLEFYMPFLIILAICLAVSLGFIIDYYRHKQFLILHSISLKELKLLNNKYHFFSFVSFDMKHIYDNINFFNDISCQDFLIYKLQFQQANILQQINKIAKNEIEYEKYLQSLKLINQMGQYDIPCGELRIKKLLKIEEKLFNQEILNPTRSFNLTVNLYYSKMNGTIYNKKSRTFEADDILYLSKKINDKKGSFFNNYEIWTSISKVERGKVSNKMRFSIYERDGYRCRNCGISSKYASLEIDHIIPISKGGKSTYNNLQTLCHRCNAMKGDSIPNQKRNYK